MPAQQDPINRLAHMMRTPPAVLLGLERKMDELTGQEGVMEDIVRANDIVVEQTMSGLGLTHLDGAETVRAALIERLGHLDVELYTMLGKPDLSVMSEACRKLCETVLRVYTPPRGMFMKRDHAASLLEKYPPHNLLEHFGYTNVRELLDREGFASVMASLRFTQTEEWMHQFFDVGYRALTPDDFEDRDVELVILDAKWAAVAEKFLKKKYHNVSHLKEYGIIFIIPIKLDTPGETLRLFTLLLHYLHEVPFYANLFRSFMGAADFSGIFRSLLRGDVTTTPLPDGGKVAWRVVQRYLAKENADDFRLFEPHVNPEADHWWRAEEDLGRLSRILGHEPGELDLGWWTGLDFVGELFDVPALGRSELVSFDLIDLLMSTVELDRVKYLYHQQEALWNKIFVEYMGRERLEELVNEHIVDGFITLT
ncbi:MAG TPA: hypothetical protein VMJ72_03120 [Candidatus Paceibacterota bacterium]|nr:hypothetical protein [Candidatus Paceibacterota bacterium]